MAGETSMEIDIMRAMAWERAKGELRAYLQTYRVGEEGDFFEEAERLISEFITKMEI